MEKDWEFIELFELYKDLLTEKQRELFSSHYLFDLSLAEIAEPDGNTRQSVYAVVKMVKKKLDEYENLFHLKEKNDKLRQFALKLDDKTKSELLSLIGE